MRTALISDLHLGAVSGRNVLRLSEPRERLVTALEGAERVVVLGDLLELREQPVARVLETAAPALEALGEACRDKELIVVPGNHDHHLAGAFLDRLRLEDQDLGLEQHAEASGHPGLLGRLAEMLAGAELSLAYPGLWLREDVYATHGHQVDVHMTVPRPEAIMASAMRRVTLRRAPSSPADYEAILDPLYSLFHGIAQASSQTALKRTGGASRKGWRLLEAGGLGGWAVGRVGVPAGVLALNAAGFGPFRPKVTGEELRNSGLRAMSQAVEVLGVRAQHVLFGHTHRPWPLPGRDGEWRTPSGALLHNTGSWYHEGSLIAAAGARSPYWPGAVTWLDDEGPPRLENVLEGVALG
ncbi:MAG: metallophosphoesterase family protein [Actinomycetota bacterium]|nr:metallophosphoesterase family protein [Actinomycetota bacterium]